MEKLHAFVTFPVLLIYVLLSYPIRSVVFLAYGLIICIAILYQGQHYWKLKLKSLKGESLDHEKNMRFFTSAKKINRIFIRFIPVVFLLQVGLQDWSVGNNTMLYWGILAHAFGILEHVNYYHTQLMIDNKYDIDYVIRNKKLKQASLAKDLIEGEI